MYKKFIENMIVSAVENEFGFSAALDAKNISFYKDNTFETALYFSFDTIFENGTVYGWLNTNGSVDWVKGHESYKIAKNYYSNK